MQLEKFKLDIKKDISKKDFIFDPNMGLSLRDRIRDLVDIFIRRPFFKLIYCKKYNLLPYRVDLVLPEKGMSLLERRRWLNKYFPIKSSRILVIGCGPASDFALLLKFQPAEIVGIELLNYSYCWEMVKEYVIQNSLPTKLNFYQVDAVDLKKLNLGMFDIIISDAVFEHCKDLQKVVRNCYTLLQPEGIMYAGYGQFWYCWGGDHFSGRDNIKNGFNHLLLNPEEYSEYFNCHVGDLEYELGDGGGGGLFVPLDLFSKLSHYEYIELFEQTGFHLKEMIVEFSANAEKALKSKELKEKLLKQFPKFTTDDFIFKSHIAIFRKHK